MRQVGLVRLVGGLAVALALLGATISTGEAQGGTASLTIHNRLCPSEYSGDDVFGDCHGNPQNSGLEFAITGPVSDSGPTDANGDITFGGLPAGTYGISGGVPGEFASTVVYCSVNEDPNNVLPVTSTATGVSIDVPDGAAVVCDWYNIPFDLSGNGGDDGDDDDTATTLPNTGAGVAGGHGDAGLFLGGAAVLALAGMALVSRRRALRF